MAIIDVVCQSYGGIRVYRHGKAPSGEQRYRYRECRNCFQLHYRYNANALGVAEKIIDLAMNGSGVRDTGRVLGISPTTVIAHLKNLSFAKFTHGYRLEDGYKPSEAFVFYRGLKRRRSDSTAFWPCGTSAAHPTWKKWGLWL